MEIGSFPCYANRFETAPCFLQLKHAQFCSQSATALANFPSLQRNLFHRLLKAETPACKRENMCMVHQAVDQRGRDLVSPKMEFHWPNSKLDVTMTLCLSLQSAITLNNNSDSVWLKGTYPTSSRMSRSTFLSLSRNQLTVPAANLSCKIPTRSEAR